MKLIKLICSNCNAPLEVDDDQKQIECKYCHTINYLDDESIKVEHTVYSGEKEERIKNANALLKIKEYDKAYQEFELLSSNYSYEPDIWYSMILCLTKNFTDYEYNPDDNIEEQMIIYNDDFEKFLKSEEEKLNEKISICDDYFEKYLKLDENKSRKKERIRDYNKYKANVTDSLNNFIDRHNQEEQTNKSQELKIMYITVLIIVGIAILIVIFSIVVESISKTKTLTEKTEVESYLYIDKNV